MQQSPLREKRNDWLTRQLPLSMTWITIELHNYYDVPRLNDILYEHVCTHYTISNRTDTADALDVADILK